LRRHFEEEEDKQKQKKREIEREKEESETAGALSRLLSRRFPYYELI
jgi:hypothetical protein